MHSGKGSDWANTKWFERTKTSAFGANSPERWFCDADPSSRSNTQRECPSEGLFYSRNLKPIKHLMRRSSQWWRRVKILSQMAKIQMECPSSRDHTFANCVARRSFPSHKRSHWGVEEFPFLLISVTKPFLQGLTWISTKISSTDKSSFWKCWIIDKTASKIYLMNL